MQVDDKKKPEEYPDEFDSKRFLDFVRERFSSPVMPEEQLLIRFTEFISSQRTQGPAPSEEEVLSWYQELVDEVETAKRPLDVQAGSDLSNPHGPRRPSLEKRMAEFDREVSLASAALQQKHGSKKPEDKRPRAPGSGDVE